MISTQLNFIIFFIILNQKDTCQILTKFCTKFDNLIFGDYDALMF